MASKEEILKELHQDDSDVSDEDLDLPVVKKKVASQATSSADPLQEEK